MILTTVMCGNVPLQTYQCGPDSISDGEIQGELGIDPASVDYLAYSYESGCYAGDGLGIVKFKDGEFGWHCLGHCSCYGPLDNPAWDRCSLDSLLADTKVQYPGLYTALCILEGI